MTKQSGRRRCQNKSPAARPPAAGPAQGRYPLPCPAAEVQVPRRRSRRPSPRPAAAALGAPRRVVSAAGIRVPGSRPGAPRQHLDTLPGAAAGALTSAPRVASLTLAAGPGCPARGGGSGRGGDTRAPRGRGRAGPEAAPAQPSPSGTQEPLDCQGDLGCGSARVAAVGLEEREDAREGGGEKARQGRSRDSPPFPPVPEALRQEQAWAMARGQEGLSPLPFLTDPAVAPVSLSQRGAAFQHQLLALHLGLTAQRLQDAARNI